MMFESMAEELLKIAEDAGVTTQEAQEALKRLRTLEKTAPSKAKLLRGASLGAIAGPTAGLLSDVIMGSQGAGGAKKGLLKAMAVGGRKILARAGTGAIYGGALPYARHKLERGAELQKLREYAGVRKRGKLRGQIQKYTGI